ncbi:MAG TPA: AraC family transcriptional regulator [Pedobacter sp.]|nr:AraC family transcriptional regulator [Pedobacter sp.]
MNSTESIAEFYKYKLGHLPVNVGNDIAHFNVFKLEESLGHGCTEPVKYTRRDFYKISLIRGKSIFHYADKSLETSGSTLMFFNPQVPYTWEPLTDEATGFFCIFREAFFTENLRSNIKDMPMFMAAGKPSYALDATQDELISQIFHKIMAEIGSDYRFKFDLIRNHVTELIHVALKMQPTERLYQHADANARITAIFSELLERQFPIETPAQQFILRSARDFADKLAVHVNHLNRAIKETTGKTTSQHISERLAAEAKALLRHTSWNISEISYCLGFEEPAHFNHFFKKHTAITPTAFRIAV